jgi:hypothetical protein
MTFGGVTVALLLLLCTVVLSVTMKLSDGAFRHVGRAVPGCKRGRIPAVQTDTCCDFPQHLDTDAGIVYCCSCLVCVVMSVCCTMWALLFF